MSRSSCFSSFVDYKMDSFTVLRVFSKFELTYIMNFKFPEPTLSRTLLNGNFLDLFIYYEMSVKKETDAEKSFVEGENSRIF